MTEPADPGQIDNTASSRGPTTGPRARRMPVGANELVQFPCDGFVTHPDTGQPMNNGHSSLMRVGDHEVWVPLEHTTVRDGMITMPAWRARDLHLDLGEDRIEEDNQPRGLSTSPFGSNPSQRAGSQSVKGSEAA